MQNSHFAARTYGLHLVFCRSSNSTIASSGAMSTQSVAHTKSAVTYMVVFQDAISNSKIEQLCSSAPSNYGFSCDQIFSKTFKGFTTTVSSLCMCLWNFFAWTVSCRVMEAAAAALIALLPLTQVSCLLCAHHIMFVKISKHADALHQHSGIINTLHHTSSQTLLV